MTLMYAMHTKDIDVCVSRYLDVSNRHWCMQCRCMWDVGGGGRHRDCGYPFFTVIHHISRQCVLHHVYCMHRTKKWVRQWLWIPILHFFIVEPLFWFDVCNRHDAISSDVCGVGACNVMYTIHIDVCNTHWCMQYILNFARECIKNPYPEQNSRCVFPFSSTSLYLKTDTKLRLRTYWGSRALCQGHNCKDTIVNNPCFFGNLFIWKHTLNLTFEYIQDPEWDTIVKWDTIVNVLPPNILRIRTPNSGYICKHSDFFSLNSKTDLKSRLRIYWGSGTLCAGHNCKYLYRRALRTCSAAAWEGKWAVHQSPLSRGVCVCVRERERERERERACL